MLWREEVAVIWGAELRKVSGKRQVDGRNTGQALIEALKGLRGLELSKFSA